MHIWYDILFAFVNFICKILQSKDMHIDVVMDHLKDLNDEIKQSAEYSFRIEYFFYT